MAGEGFPGKPRAAAAALFVSDPEATIPTPGEILAGLHGLTAAESRLVQCLLQGKRLKDAAEELAITANTAKTHLKRIFRKTETNSQSELIRLILSGPIMVAGNDQS